MKLVKSLVALMLIVATIFAMTVPAFAATKDEAYNSAVKTGAPNHNLAELKNYLNTVSFTAEEYDKMVYAAERVENIVTSYSMSLYGVIPEKLSEKQKFEVFKSMPYDTRQTVISILVSLGTEVGVKVYVDLINETEGYTVSATDKNGKLVTSSSNKPVVDTSYDYTALVVVMSVILTAAICGVAFTSRKVRN